MSDVLLRGNRASAVRINGELCAAKRPGQEENTETFASIPNVLR